MMWNNYGRVFAEYIFIKDFRNGKLEDIDGPLLFLCSEASAYVTGQVLMVDGGFTAK